MNERLDEQFRVTGLADAIGPDNIYRAHPGVGLALEQAYHDALAWVAARTNGDSGNDDRT